MATPATMPMSRPLDSAVFTGGSTGAQENTHIVNTGVLLVSATSLSIIVRSTMMNISFGETLTPNKTAYMSTAITDYRSHQLAYVWHL